MQSPHWTRIYCVIICTVPAKVTDFHAGWISCKSWTLIIAFHLTVKCCQVRIFLHHLCHIHVSRHSVRYSHPLRASLTRPVHRQPRCLIDSTVVRSPRNLSHILSLIRSSTLYAAGTGDCDGCLCHYIKHNSRLHHTTHLADLLQVETPRRVN